MPGSIDVAGVTVTVPDPEAIADLSSRFQGMGDEFAAAAEQLAALASPQAVTPWTGLAADAFAQTVGPLPGQLSSAGDAYRTAAAALSRYAGQVGQVVATLTALSGQAADAASDLGATQAAYDQVSGQDPVSPDLPALGERLSSAQHAVAGLQARARAQRSELEQLATSCAASLRNAAPHVPKPGLLSRLGHDAVNDVLKPVAEAVKHDLLDPELAGLKAVASDVVEPIAIAAKRVIVDPFIRLGEAEEEFVEHPSLAHLSEALADLTGALGVVLLLVPGLDLAVGPALIAVAAAALATDAGAMALGETNAAGGEDEAVDVLGDSLGEGLRGAAGIVKAADTERAAGDALDSAAADAPAAVKAPAGSEAADAGGTTVKHAMQFLSTQADQWVDAQQDALLRAGIEPDDSTAVAALKSAGEGADLGDLAHAATQPNPQPAKEPAQ